MQQRRTTATSITVNKTHPEAFKNEIQSTLQSLIHILNVGHSKTMEAGMFGKVILCGRDGDSGSFLFPIISLTFIVGNFSCYRSSTILIFSLSFYKQKRERTTVI